MMPMVYQYQISPSTFIFASQGHQIGVWMGLEFWVGVKTLWDLLRMVEVMRPSTSRKSEIGYNGEFMRLNGDLLERWEIIYEIMQKKSSTQE